VLAPKWFVSRWRWALLPVLLCSVCIVLFRPSGKAALEDTDTAYLLKIIRSNPDPVSGRPQSALNWFTGDWPLHNHFYRPISTLTFEADSRIHGDDGSGYGLTNALIAACCVMTLFWLLAELSGNVFLSSCGALLFGLWNLGVNWPEWLVYAPLPVLALAFFRRGLRVWDGVVAAGATAFVLLEVSSRNLAYAAVAWVPGRTATTMTLFCLISMAAYARFARRTSKLLPAPEQTPLDPPATRNTIVEEKLTMAQWPWICLGFVSCLLALGCHEQAIMLPGAVIGVAVSLRLRRYAIRWAWPMSFLLVLAGYLWLRHAVLPPGVSQYQQQQLRSGEGALQAFFGYAIPDLFPAWQALSTGQGLGLNFWQTLIPYASLWALFTDISAVVVAGRRWIPALTGWALSLIAYLPMAWVKPFPHYDYWPLALRSLFVAALLAATGEAILSAWSPPALRLPSRRAPAPGSLPRR